MTSGAVYCWGQKSGNNLPIVTADGNISTPTQAQGLLSGAAPGILHVCGLSATTGQGDYAVYAWLANDTVLAWGNKFLNGTTQAESNSSNPQEVSFSRRGGAVAGIAAWGMMDGTTDARHSVAVIMADGTMLVMGQGAPIGLEPAYQDVGGTLMFAISEVFSWSLSEASMPW